MYILRSNFCGIIRNFRVLPFQIKVHLFIKLWHSMITISKWWIKIAGLVRTHPPKNDEIKFTSEKKNFWPIEISWIVSVNVDFLSPWRRSFQEYLPSLRGLGSKKYQTLNWVDFCFNSICKCQTMQYKWLALFFFSKSPLPIEVHKSPNENCVLVFVLVKVKVANRTVHVQHSRTISIYRN